MSASEKSFQARRGIVFLAISLMLLLASCQPQTLAIKLSPLQEVNAEQAAAQAVAPVPPPAPAPALPDAAVLVQGVRQMTAELIRSLAEPDPQQGDLAEGMVVCSFTDLAKLSRTSSMGRLLAEQLMGEFAAKRYTVVDLRKSSSITIQERRGEFGLSRDPEEVKPALSVGAMLTGTYQVAGEHIIINARIMDNRNAVLLASASMLLPLKGAGEKLLADAASKSEVKHELLYKKRLDL